MRQIRWLVVASLLAADPASGVTDDFNDNVINSELWDVDESVLVPVELES